MSDYDWTSCNVLVTGAGGFLGSWLVHKLHALGATVVGLVPNRHDLHSLEQRGLAGKMDVWFGDVCDEELLKNIVSKHDINMCFHVAAVSQVRRSSANPLSAFKVNIQGTWTILDVCRRRSDFRAFVGASSDKAYGDHGDVAYTEDMALLGLHAYDVSKACMDMLVRSYALQYSLPAVVTRCANLYGPGDLNWDRLIPNTIRRIKRGQAPVLHEGAEHFVREMLYIEDAVDGYLMLATAIGATKGQAYNLGAGPEITVSHLIGELSRLLNATIAPEIRPRERSFKEIPRQRIEAAKIRNLGWKPRVSLQDGLQATVNWYAELLETGRPPPLS